MNDRVRMSQNLKNVRDEDYADLRRPKKVVFFINGDRSYSGKLVRITPNRYLVFHELLSDLTRYFSQDIANGVRRIYDKNGRRMTDLNQLEDDHFYICSSTASFKDSDYQERFLDFLSRNDRRDQKLKYNYVDSSTKYDNSSLPSVPLYYNGNKLFHVAKPNEFNNSLKYSSRTAILLDADQEPSTRKRKYFEPKAVTIILAYERPYAYTQILIKRNNTQSYEEFLTDISKGFGLKRMYNSIKKLVAKDGTEIQNMSSLFNKGNIFIGQRGHDSPLTRKDINKIISETLPKNEKDNRRKDQNANQFLQPLTNVDEESDNYESSTLPTSDFSNIGLSKKNHRGLYNKNSYLSNNAKSMNQQKSRIPQVYLNNEPRRNDEFYIKSKMSSSDIIPAQYKARIMEYERLRVTNEDRKRTRKTMLEEIEKQRALLDSYKKQLNEYENKENLFQRQLINNRENKYNNSSYFQNRNHPRNVKMNTRDNLEQGTKNNDDNKHLRKTAQLEKKYYPYNDEDKEDLPLRRRDKKLVRRSSYEVLENDEAMLRRSNITESDFSSEEINNNTNKRKADPLTYKYNYSTQTRDDFQPRMKDHSTSPFSYHNYSPKPYNEENLTIKKTYRNHSTSYNYNEDFKTFNKNNKINKKTMTEEHSTPRMEVVKQNMSSKLQSNIPLNDNEILFAKENSPNNQLRNSDKNNEENIKTVTEINLQGKDPNVIQSLQLQSNILPTANDNLKRENILINNQLRPDDNKKEEYNIIGNVEVREQSQIVIPEDSGLKDTKHVQVESVPSFYQPKNSDKDKEQNSYLNKNIQLVNQEENVDENEIRTKIIKESVTPLNIHNPREDIIKVVRSGRVTEDPQVERFNSKLIIPLSEDRDFYEIFSVGKLIAKGNLSEVKEAKKNVNGQSFAVKIIEKSKLENKDLLEDEIRILKSCDHPKIIRLMEQYESPRNIFLVTELLTQGDLFDAISEHIKFTEFQASVMIKDLCQALAYLHSRGIVHRDIKPENILVVKTNGVINLKLADFGLAVEYRGPLYAICGTPTYVAPEILGEQGYGPEVDMWAVGIVLYILLCGFPPFRSADRNQIELFELIKVGEFEYLLPYWDNISRGVMNLIDKLIVIEPSRRYSAKDVLSHPWILTEGNGKQFRNTTGEI